MLTPQYILPIHEEITVDLFAGGGGASTGIERAIGRPVDIAVNHNPEAISLHSVNHPQTLHFVCDVFEIDPVKVCGSRPVGLLWASPDCRHFSRAKGGKPVSKKVRGLAWVVTRWAKAVRPRLIHIENVPEMLGWSPLGEDGLPCKKRKGRTFKRWKRSLETLGYQVDFRVDTACDYGAPTSRKRLFLVARCDGEPIVFPKPTHAAPDSLAVRAKKLKPWRTAAECIDFSIPCPSIFDRRKPLADATLGRIARGLVRFVLEDSNPFIVPQDGHSPASADSQAVGRCAAFLAKHYGGVVGIPVREPVATVTSKDHHSLVVSHLIKLRGTSKGAQSVREPLHTISAQGTHHAEVRALLMKYGGLDRKARSRKGPAHAATQGHHVAKGPHRASACDQHPLIVTIAGEEWVVVDIGMRMLSPRELFRAQGFPESYIIDRRADGTALTKTAQVHMCGNSVPPVMAEAYVRANYRDRQPERLAA